MKLNYKVGGPASVEHQNFIDSNFLIAFSNLKVGSWKSEASS